jgi:hypothetical protein
VWGRGKEQAMSSCHSFARRRVRREVADVEHRPQQLGLGQDGLRPRNNKPRHLVRCNLDFFAVLVFIDDRTTTNKNIVAFLPS